MKRRTNPKKPLEPESKAPAKKVPTLTTFLRDTESEVDGGYETIKCRKGLWSVTCPKDEKARLLAESWHYYTQYFADGEYDDLPTPDPNHI